VKKGLGRRLGSGLDALISGGPDGEDQAQAYADMVSSRETLQVDIDKVKPNKDQPRKYFEESHIEELAESIKEFGIIQPLIVKKEEDIYIIVAGERRWRAAGRAGLDKLPVIVREYSDKEALEIALIENIQREDLNPIEEANCYKKLNEEFNITHDVLAKRVGKSRSHISNSIRLLKLDQRVQNFIIGGELTVGHAKAILPIENRDIQHFLARKMVEEGMNVREAEEFAKKYGSNISELESQKILEEDSQAKEGKGEKKELYTQFQLELRSMLGTRVNIKDSKTGGSGGKIEINYFSEEDLNRIVTAITNTKK